MEDVVTRASHVRLRLRFASLILILCHGQLFSRFVGDGFLFMWLLRKSCVQHPAPYHRGTEGKNIAHEIAGINEDLLREVISDFTRRLDEENEGGHFLGKNLKSEVSIELY